MLVLAAACMHSIQRSCEHCTETAVKLALFHYTAKRIPQMKPELINPRATEDHTRWCGCTPNASIPLITGSLFFIHQTAKGLLTPFFFHLATLCIVFVTLNPYLPRNVCD